MNAKINEFINETLLFQEGRQQGLIEGEKIGYEKAINGMIEIFKNKYPELNIKDFWRDK